MRLRAFGAEPPDTLLTSMAVAHTSIDILVSNLTGHVIDVRLDDPLAAAASPGSAGDQLAPPTAASQGGRPALLADLASPAEDPAWEKPALRE